MIYETWRISYQSSEQAARAAYAECVRLRARLEAAEKERDELRAKIEALERQEPVAFRWELKAGQYTYVDKPEHASKNDRIVPLYLAPGAQAQPTPSIPEGWKPIPEKHPTFDLVDLRLADGSVLCGCVPQSDGDYWWEGPSGEVFIDPRYAPATHWRLAAAPEAKP